MASTQFSTVSLERRDAILIATINRPEAMNALDAALISDLTALFEWLHREESVRVVILRANGRAFCAGADLKDWTGKDGVMGSVQGKYALQRAIGRIFQLMRSCSQPIVGLGHGAACGGGFSLLLACDIRYAAPILWDCA